MRDKRFYHAGLLNLEKEKKFQLQTTSDAIYSLAPHKNTPHDVTAREELIKVVQMLDFFSSDEISRRSNFEINNF